MIYQCKVCGHRIQINKERYYIAGKNFYCTQQAYQCLFTDYSPGDFYRLMINEPDKYKYIRKNKSNF